MTFSRTTIARLTIAGMLLAAGAGVALAVDDHAKPAHASPAPTATPPASDHGAGAATRATKPSSIKPSEKQTRSAPPAEAKPAPKTETKPAAKAKPSHDQDEGAPTADQAIAWLREGNARWVKGNVNHPNTTAERRTDCNDNGQKPFATILTCSDSRVPLERVFDRGVGELFTVRVAGNVAGTSEGGTIEYGVEHLHTPVLVVMGHTKCGAVAAAASENAHLEGQVGALVEQIKPAVERARAINPDLKDKELINAAIRENVWQTVFGLLRNSKLLRDKARAGELRIVGAVYDIGEGTVEFMGPHPWQSELISAFDARQAKQAHVEAPEQGSDGHGGK